MHIQFRPQTGRTILAGLLAALILPAGLAPSVSEARVRDRVERRAHSGSWVRLGSTDVDGRGDTDTINVRQSGTFRSLMFRVTESPVRIHEVVVRFEGGGEFRPRLRRNFGRGSGSHVIDLPGRRRDIDRITFRFSDLRRGRKAIVSVFGRR